MEEFGWRREGGGSSMRRNVGHLEQSLVPNSNRPQLCSQRFHFDLFLIISQVSLSETKLPSSSSCFFFFFFPENWTCNLVSSVSVLFLLVLLLNYFCPVSLSCPSSADAPSPVAPPLKFTLLCNRQKAPQIFPPKKLFLHNGAEIKKHSDKIRFR